MENIYVVIFFCIVIYVYMLGFFRYIENELKDIFSKLE